MAEWAQIRVAMLQNPKPSQIIVTDKMGLNLVRDSQQEGIRMIVRSAQTFAHRVCTKTIVNKNDLKMLLSHAGVLWLLFNMLSNIKLCSIQL